MSERSDRVEVVFCYDFASPYSYLADCMIDQALGEYPVDLVRTPVYLRGFESFSKAPPHAAKLAYLARDIMRCAEFLGIPLAAPKSFPVNGLYLLRGSVFLAERPELSAFMVAAFRATWAEAREVSSAEHAADIAAEVGVDRDEFLAAISTPTVKEQLKRNTEACVARGGFGVPSFFVGDEMYWGHDRIDQLCRHLDRLS